MLARITDDDSPLEFWQHSAPTTYLLRLVGLRVCSGKAAALGCERLWSGARQIFTDNRRSLRTARIMQLINVKLNGKLLRCEDSSTARSELLSEMDASFDSIFETVALMEEEEEAAARLAAERGNAQDAAIVGSDADMEEEHASDSDKGEPLDLFADD